MQAGSAKLQAASARLRQNAGLRKEEKNIAMRPPVCLLSPSSSKKDFKYKTKMKLNQIAFKALLVAGIVGTMLNASVASAATRKAVSLPPAPVTVIAVASLTAAQQAALASADGTTLANAAAAIIAATPANQRAEMAKAIAKYVATNKTAAAATAVVTRLVADVPAAASVVIQVALKAAPALQAALTTAMPAQATTIATVAAEAVILFSAPPITISNPLTQSANN